LDDAYKTHSVVDDNASACIDSPVGHDKRTDYIRFHSYDYDGTDDSDDGYYSCCTRMKSRGGSDTADDSRVDYSHRHHHHSHSKLKLKLTGVVGTTGMTRTVYTVLQFQSFYKMTVKWV
jgi:hypothetical protein